MQKVLDSLARRKQRQVPRLGGSAWQGPRGVSLLFYALLQMSLISGLHFYGSWLNLYDNQWAIFHSEHPLLCLLHKSSVTGPYNLFVQEHFDNIAKDGSALTVSQIDARQLDRIWAAMSDEERNHYRDKFNQQKQRLPKIKRVGFLHALWNQCYQCNKLSRHIFQIDTLTCGL